MKKLEGKLTVIMPAYNEEKHIYSNIIETAETISDFATEYEIIAVDDGSSDETFAQLTLAAKTNEHIILLHSICNEGKGSALKSGTSMASGDFVAFCDADLDLHPRQLERFFEIMAEEDADAVIGSKMHPESKVNYPLIRKIYSYGYYIFLKLLLQINTKDTQTGLKLFKINLLKPAMAQVQIKGFAFDIELLSIMQAHHAKIVSAPIEVNFRRGAFGRVGLKDVCTMFQDTFKVFYRLRIRHFYK